MARAAATWRAVGKVSLEDWDMFTWSLGWTGRDGSSLAHRWAMTSLTFMLDWVPLPVCQTFRGNSPGQRPARIWSQAAVMRPHLASSSLPLSRLARAAAFFKRAKARMIPSGMVSVPMAKF